MVFLSQNENKAKAAQDVLAKQLSAQGLQVQGWRDVPVDAKSACGQQVRDTLPLIRQIFVNAPEGMFETNFDRRLFIARRLAEKTISDNNDFYIPSLVFIYGFL